METLSTEIDKALFVVSFQRACEDEDLIDIAEEGMQGAREQIEEWEGSGRIINSND